MFSSLSKTLFIYKEKVNIFLMPIIMINDANTALFATFLHCQERAKQRVFFATFSTLPSTSKVIKKLVLVFLNLCEKNKEFTVELFFQKGNFNEAYPLIIVICG